MNLNRREILQMSAASLLPTGTASGTTDYRFHHDHVMGTSLDLVIFAGNVREAHIAETAVLEEIARLSRILSTYDPESEVSRLAQGTATHSPELAAVFAAYTDWNRRTGGAIASRVNGKLNLDALGKPFIAASAVEAARRTGIAGILLDAGGDVVVSGTPGTGSHWPVGVSDPHSPYFNAAPLSILNVVQGAVATSGITARGAHIVDPRTGIPAVGVLAATVVAPDAVTANALSTAICVLGPDAGLRLVANTRGAECMIVPASGPQVRSAGFSRFERPVIIPALAEATWPAGFEVLIEMNLKDAGSRRPYVAVWVEDMSKHLVRNIVFFFRKPRYLNELRSWWSLNSNNQNLAYVTARPTPAPGRYLLHWDGLDDKKNPVPAGTYKIFIETAREHSYYEKEFAQIACLDAPATAMTKKTPEFDPVVVTFGPKKQTA